MPALKSNELVGLFDEASVVSEGGFPDTEVAAPDVPHEGDGWSLSRVTTEEKGGDWRGELLRDPKIEADWKVDKRVPT